MSDDKTPAWGSPEMNEAIADHDAQADPEREKKGLKYTKTRNPANEDKGGKGKKR